MRKEESKAWEKKLVMKRREMGDKILSVVTFCYSFNKPSINTVEQGLIDN